ncbi:putative mitochondrial fatty acid elongase [Leptomonas pyrrhocoris]|uniref:Elongation of fatty acids protein n=1 Tax=Leptomonas pyrrhocoris TaxID=157538 RepID=A0A0M9FW16_LEPPY|nr:putative mitochondrial fatty acid elongase [Leptomonas pyrrhocoris]XP_015655689.1 putative mitochondrial fatty acid elongase [Leptomonas pyrrhocoris]KPA77249.1 putative mitochondrial fatty acid elongase [Leptomonas pyrrhocoris]KPA77250.1 putative mitochondrial fatty acid elongase [Leptomonas pyrrhocoris]|eukprot:XP_015655688.1 putative mitochondrial fatty acid elongase [Leptomonas pyrrhocoris]
MQRVADFLDGYRGEAVCAWMRANLEIPSVVTVLYIVTVLYVPNMFMNSRHAYNLRTLNLLWNLLLTVFSMAGACYCIPQALRSLFVANFTVRNYQHGGQVELHGSLYSGICGWDDNLFCDGPVGAFVLLFIVSKIPEMLDTVFLIFQKKKVIFLHWYHHATVMLYCWHSYAVRISGGLIFASMNYGVHSIMYLYFFLCACGYRKYVRPIAPFVTFLQIAQMVVGMVVEAVTLYHMYVSGKGCASNATNARVGFMMYVSYFGLFSKLFYDNYMSGRAAQSAAAVAVEHGAPPRHPRAAPVAMASIVYYPESKKLVTGTHTIQRRH